MLTIKIVSRGKFLSFLCVVTYYLAAIGALSASKAAPNNRSRIKHKKDIKEKLTSSSIFPIEK
jgi:hypothetical protein